MYGVSRPTGSAAIRDVGAGGAETLFPLSPLPCPPVRRERLRLAIEPPSRPSGRGRLPAVARIEQTRGN